MDSLRYDETTNAKPQPGAPIRCLIHSGEPDRVKRHGGPQVKRPCVQMLDGKIINRYPSASAAASKLGCDPTTIARACRGEQKSAKGFTWRYEDEEM